MNLTVKLQDGAEVVIEAGQRWLASRYGTRAIHARRKVVEIQETRLIVEDEYGQQRYLSLGGLKSWIDRWEARPVVGRG